MIDVISKVQKKINRVKRYLSSGKLKSKKKLLAAIREEVELVAKTMYVQAGREAAGGEATQSIDEIIVEYVKTARFVIDPSTLAEFIKDQYTADEKQEWFAQGYNAVLDEQTDAQLAEQGWVDIDTALGEGKLLGPNGLPVGTKPQLVDKNGVPIFNL